MKSTETKTKPERMNELIEGLELAGREYIVAIEQARKMSLAAINMMLAIGEEFWGTDYYESMIREKGILDRYFAESVITDLESVIEADKDVTADNEHTLVCMHLLDAVVDWSVEKIEILTNHLKDNDLERFLQVA